MRACAMMEIRVRLPRQVVKLLNMAGREGEGQSDSETQPVTSLSDPLPGALLQPLRMLPYSLRRQGTRSCTSLSAVKSHKDLYWLHTWSWMFLAPDVRSLIWLCSPIYGCHQLSVLQGFLLRVDTNGAQSFSSLPPWRQYTGPLWVLPVGQGKRWATTKWQSLVCWKV